MDVEQVLVFPADLHGGLQFQGVLNDKQVAGAMLKEITRFAIFMPRPEAEKDPDYKQLIPYVVFQYDEPGGETQLFSYVRGTDQGEARLHAKRSIGVGGHINRDDTKPHVFDDPYVAGMHREIHEEVIVSTRMIASNVPDALINDDSNEVGRVHLGVVHIIRVNNPRVLPREKSMVESGFFKVSTLFEVRHQLETWSRLVLQAFYAPALAEPASNQEMRAQGLAPHLNIEATSEEM